MQIEDQIYGSFELQPLFRDLIQTRLFQRLKGIHQGGAIIIADPSITLTRYEHSIGVMLLIKKLGGSLEEQVAGLLHDLSHTAFSHLVDYVLDYENEDYHEQIFAIYLSDPEIVEILNRYGLDYRQFLDLEQFSVLDYPMPSLCADRIDYTLRDLYHLKKISKEDMDWFVDGLIVQEGRIFVKSRRHANWFRIQFTYLNDSYFNGKESQQASQFMSKTVRHYYESGLISKADFGLNDLQFIEKIEGLSGQAIRSMYNQWLRNGKDKIDLKFKSRKVLPDVI